MISRNVFYGVTRNYLTTLANTVRRDVVMNALFYSHLHPIGADGANSKLRSVMGVHYLNWMYDERSVVATVELAEEGTNTAAWQRFNPDGPIALLPLTSKYSSLVWTTTKEKSRELLKLPNDQFIDAVNDAFWKKYPSDQVVSNASKMLNELLHKFNCPTDRMRQLPPQVVGMDEGSRAAFPLAFGHCSEYIQQGVALIGDAAHRIHPLAGQGVNLGFKDAEILADEIGEAVYRGDKIGSFTTLKHYQQRSQKHNVPTVFGIDALQKLYSTNFTPVVLIRSLGLQLVHSIPPVKKLIMAHAQG